MLKIIKIILLYLIISNLVFAETNIEIKSSKNIINIDEYFTLNIELFSDWNFLWWEIKINWLNDFKQISNTNSSSKSIINWKITNKNIIWLKLKANKLWEYKIWPASIVYSGTTLVSNKLNISIVEKQRQKLLNTIKNDPEWNDIKWIKQNYNIFLYIILLPFIIVLLIIVWYLIFFKKKNKTKFVEKKEIKIDLSLLKKKIIKELIKLKKEKDSFCESRFYEILNILFRNYFNLLWVQNSHFLTLKEIKKLNLNKNLILLFEQSYLNEFNKINNSEKNKDLIIDEFIKLLK